ncbi:involved in de novo 2-like protein [Tanacetum coccineum]|uniref:Involved in de novo 2-like protein n=1 Tax=Tanacetum coccineum TaxID=301880 RepID=A0ABQ5DEL6_9ASTR
MMEDNIVQRFSGKSGAGSSNNIHGELFSQNDVRTVPEIIMTGKGPKATKLMSNLTNVMEVKKRRLEEMEGKYMETKNTISKLIAENDKLQQSYYEEVKEMQFSIREHFQWICNDHEMVNLKLQGQEKELELRSTELQKREDNQLAIMEQKKAEERMLKLAEDQKREKEKLHDQIIELQKKLDDKQRLELEIRQMKGALKVMEHMTDSKKKRDLIQEDLKEKEDAEGLMENSARSLISVKRMGVLDVKPFIAAAKRNGSGKNETIKMASLWESHLMDPSWHPFKVITVGGKIKHRNGNGKGIRGRYGNGKRQKSKIQDTGTA